jgi:Tol biopolymer transport system component
VRRITNDLNSYSRISLTAAGDALVVQRDQFRSNLWLVSLEEGRAERVSAASGLAPSWFSWTPDGKIIYMGEKSDLWIADLEKYVPMRLTFDGSSFAPAPSTDGRYVVLARDTGSINLWRVDLDGGNPVQLTFGDLEGMARCHPDGRWVLYVGQTPEGPALFKVPIEGGDPVRLEGDRIMSFQAPAISPDGKRIAVSIRDNATKSNRIEIIPYERGGQGLILDYPPGEMLIGWTPDGRALTYIDVRDGVGNVWAQPLDGGPPRQLTYFMTDLVTQANWSPNGKKIALIRGEDLSDIILLKNFR